MEMTDERISKIESVIFGLDKSMYNSLVKDTSEQKKDALYKSVRSACVFFSDKTSDFLDLMSISDEEKSLLIDACVKAADENNISGKKRTVEFKNDNSLAYKDAISKVNGKYKKRVAGRAGLAAAAVIAAGTGLYALNKSKASTNVPDDVQDQNELSIEDSNEEVNEINEVEESHGYGLYKFDLASMLNMSEYVDNPQILDSKQIEEKYGIKGVTQKDRAQLRLNILQSINKEIKLFDGETDQLAGLTIEQLIAIDAYSNSNVYNSYDYIKNFGLYDFSNVQNDFQQATIHMAGYLAHPGTDGTKLADIFLDEVVKDNYLKQLDYLNKILTSEKKEDRKKIVNEYNEFLRNCSLNPSSEEYVDYSDHPGMAFATSTIAMALNYHNISLDKELNKRVLLTGDDDVQSKLNSICANANQKLDSAIELVEYLERTLITSESKNRVNDNLAYIEAAKTAGGTIKLSNVEEAEIVVTKLLCDQEQLDSLINKDLAETNQYVTGEMQKAIDEDSIVIAQNVENRNYVDDKTEKISKALEEGNGKAEFTEKQVTINTPEAKKDLEQKAPQQVQDAKNEVNQEQGLIANETPEEQKKTEEKINNDVNNAQQDANNMENIYNSVVSYYETNGNVDGIPSELQGAYDSLGSNLFDKAKVVGTGRYNINHSDGQKTVTNENGETTTTVVTGSDDQIFDEFKDAEITDHEVKPVPSVDNTTKVESGVSTNAEQTGSNTSTSAEQSEPVQQVATESNTIVVNPEFVGAEITGHEVQPVQSVDNTTTNGIAPVVEGISSEVIANSGTVIIDYEYLKSLGLTQEDIDFLSGVSFEDNSDTYTK